MEILAYAFVPISKSANVFQNTANQTGYENSTAQKYYQSQKRSASHQQRITSTPDGIHCDDMEFVNNFTPIAWNFTL